MTSNGDKFRLMMWKNALIHRRHPWRTMLEIGLPIVLFLFVLLFPTDGRQSSAERRYRPLSVDQLANTSAPYSIAYSPQNDLLQKIVSEACASLGIETFKAFNSSYQMQTALVNGTYLCGIDFGDTLKHVTTLPNTTTFTLRFPSELRFPTGSITEWHTNSLAVDFSARNYFPDKDDGGPPSYRAEEFLAVQAAVSRALVSNLTPNLQLPHVLLQRFAAPNDLYNDELDQLLPRIMPFLLRLALTFCFFNTVKYIAVEKEKQLKESLKIMGVPGWIHWASWFASSFLVMIVPVTTIAILLRVSVFVYSNVFLLWCFVLLYCTSVICFAFLMTVFLSKAIHTVVLALLLWFVSWHTFAGDDTPFWLQCTSSLLSNAAMKFGMNSIIRLESVQQGLNWGTMATVTEMNDRYSFLIAALMLAVNAIVYLVLAFYLEQIIPGQFGVAKPWYFPLTKEFWTARSVKDGDQIVEPLPPRSEHFEDVSPSARAGVQIRRLRKVYDGGKMAVEGLDLDLYEGQITALLGHNGAGKTTTLSMLTGMFSPSSGTAFVDGLDIGTSMTTVRSRTGYCPQHNVLFDELTPEEHLEIAARLKGVRRLEIDILVTVYLSRLGLIEKRKAQSSTLSGGMKRKLSIGMALCGGPKVVLLDEPTTGVDASARHDLWEFLAAEKHDKTILLSTHFMNEADVLSDRIAILADGKLVAAGSPFYLKNEFGVGYHLICAKAEGFHRNQMLEVLWKYIPSAAIESENASEVTVVLKKEFVQYFEPMLEDLEQQLEYCGISSFGVSYTTMEEVFMKAGKITPSDTNDSEHLEHVSLHRSMSATASTASLLEPVARRNPLFNQFKAQLLKKFICAKRAWWQFCLQTLVVPIGALTLLAYPISLSSNDWLPPLEMSLNAYRDSLSFLSKSNASESLQLEYRRLFSDSQRLEVVDEDMNQYVLQKFNYSVLEYNSRLLVGASFTNESVTGWFNARFFHSAPLTLNLIYNAVIRTACPSCSIEVVNNPLPRKNHDANDDQNPFDDRLVNIIFAIFCIMSYVPSSYVSFYIRERTSRVKLLQIVCGLRAEFYWLTNLFWDFIALMLCCIVIIVLLIAHQLEGFVGVKQIATLMLLFFVFSMSILPLIYLLSFWIKNPTFGFIKVLLFFIIVTMVVFLLMILSVESELDTLSEILSYGLLLVPIVALTAALYKFSGVISFLAFSEAACDAIPDCTKDSICHYQPGYCSAFSYLFSFSSNGMLLEICGMLATCIICIVLIWCIEHKIFHRLRSKLGQRFTRRNAGQEARPTVDADVLLEKNRVSRMSSSDIGNYRLVFRNLTKNFGSQCAVKWLSLRTKPSECFGLLGVNGAGKTTAFRMLTGDESVSFGDAWINGASVRTNVAQAYRHVGYCPQFDGLLEELTGRETLRIFTLLRGVAASEGTAIAEELGLADHLNKRVQEYSGGMKRTLSAALALTGSPSVIFLDEPSSGMDPGAKRQLWDIINRLRDAGKTIVLTTHSMDECEALCTRLAIMVSGEFKCLGSIQHLKSKFSGGFLLFFKLIQNQPNQESMVATVKTFIAERFENAVLKEDHQTTLSYHIPKSELSWSAMFAIMEASKQELGIEEYSLGQTSLEQLFLYFSQVNC